MVSHWEDTAEILIVGKHWKFLLNKFTHGTFSHSEDNQDECWGFYLLSTTDRVPSFTDYISSILQ